jgi:hypothetical protein
LNKCIHFDVKTPLASQNTNVTRSLVPEVWSHKYNGICTIYSDSAEIGNENEEKVFLSLKELVKIQKTICIKKSDVELLRKDPMANIGVEMHPLERGRVLTFSGIVRYGSVCMGYWMKNELPDRENMSLDKDQCGVIWLAVSVKNDCRKLKSVIEVIESVLFKFNIDPIYVIDRVSVKETYIMTSLIFDFSDPVQDTNTKKCFIECEKELNNIDVFIFRRPREL